MSKRDELLSIKRAARSDRKAIERLLSRSSQGHLKEQERFVFLLPARLRRGEILLAALGRELVGASAIAGGELEGPFVEPGYRGRGIARALIDEATHEARRRGLSLIVHADEEASSFYRKCGFELEIETQAPLGKTLTLSR